MSEAHPINRWEGTLVEAYKHMKAARRKGWNNVKLRSLGTKDGCVIELGMDWYTKRTVWYCTDGEGRTLDGIEWKQNN